MADPKTTGIKFVGDKFYLWNGTGWESWNVRPDLAPVPNTGFKEYITNGTGVGELASLTLKVTSSSLRSYSIQTTKKMFINMVGGVSGNFSGINAESTYAIDLRGIKRLKVKLNNYPYHKIFKIYLKFTQEKARITQELVLIEGPNVGENYVNIPNDIVGDFAYIFYSCNVYGSDALNDFGLDSLVGEYGDRT